jgi:hypothetical protein
MNHSFLLRYYGRLSLIEQNHMTGEERKWWVDRTRKEIEKQENAGKSSVPGKRGHTPGSPPV